MQHDDPQAAFGRFVPQARSYLESPGIVAALELDTTCMKLHPLVARVLGNTELSKLIRDFVRNLPRKTPEELRHTLDAILAEAKMAGLVLPD